METIDQHGNFLPRRERSIKPFQFVEEIGPDEWEHHLEQAAWEARIRGLALRLLENDKDFIEELPWLNGPKAKSVVEFGIHVQSFKDPIQRTSRRC